MWATPGRLSCQITRSNRGMLPYTWFGEHMTLSADVLQPRGVAVGVVSRSHSTVRCRAYT